MSAISSHPRFVRTTIFYNINCKYENNTNCVNVDNYKWNSIYFLYLFHVLHLLMFNVFEFNEIGNF